MLDINVQGTFLVLKSVSAAMVAQTPQPVDASHPARGFTRGAIVNLGSIASSIVLPNSVQYVASIHAVVGLTKSAGKSCPTWLYSTRLFRLSCVRISSDYHKLLAPLTSI